MARKYNHEYKVQAVKLAKEIGGAKAAKELGIPEGAIHTWLKAVRAGNLQYRDKLQHSPTSAMSLSEEITMLRKRVKEQDKEIRRLKEENEFLEEASAFLLPAVGVSKNQRMIFLALKTEDGRITGKSRSTAECLGSAAKASINISANKDRPWIPGSGRCHERNRQRG